jgi:MYXO-CTERM domain-containing protein
LTAPIAILLAIAAGSELLFDGVFRGDATNLVAQAIGQDYVTLAVALPVLVISAVFASRGSERARLVWLSALAYVLYTYAIYAFHVRFNPLFLIYVALLGFSLYALIGGLATTNFEAVKARFTQRTPVKATSVFLTVMTVLFYLVWLSEVVPAMAGGEVPRSVADAGTPTGSTHVLDMAWVLPAMGLTALWLWRRQAKPTRSREPCSLSRR